MRGPKPDPLTLSDAERTDLEALVRRHGTPQQLALRGRIILAAAQGKNNSQIARELSLCVDTVRHWRTRWISLQAACLDDLPVKERLWDVPRPGRPSQITAEQTCQMVAMACEQPKERPISHWTGREIADARHAAWHCGADFAAACRSLGKKNDLKPHLIRSWLTPPEDPHKEQTVKAICTLYQQAPHLAQQGEHTVSTDEMTGVQALERKHPGLPLAPGKVERREFEYVRHGTRCFLLSRDVTTGKLIAPACGPTRTQADFLAHLEAVVATDPEARRWHIVCDQLNTHQSESLVRLSSPNSQALTTTWGSKERAAFWPRWRAGPPF